MPYVKYKGISVHDEIIYHWYRRVPRKLKKKWAHRVPVGKMLKNYTAIQALAVNAVKRYYGGHIEGVIPYTKAALPLPRILGASVNNLAQNDNVRRRRPVGKTD